MKVVYLSFFILIDTVYDANFGKMLLRRNHAYNHNHAEKGHNQYSSYSMTYFNTERHHTHVFFLVVSFVLFIVLHLRVSFVYTNVVKSK